MGQQQLLLIILGVIIVGIAVAVGITMFQDNAINANRDAISNDLVNLAARAQQYYRRPVGMGGGGNKFDGLTGDAAGIAKLTNNPTNDNATYTVSTAGANDVLQLTGTSLTKNAAGDAIVITCDVTPTGYTITATN